MSATNQFETDLLELIFNNLASPNIGDASGLQPSATEGSLYFSLHDSALADTDTNQNSNEVAYTGYARVAVARNSSAFTVSGNTVENAGLITFPPCTGGSVTATHFGIGYASSGAGFLLFHGELTTSIAISNGITPDFPAGNLVITLD